MMIALPDERGGWWHDYVCEAHGVELEHAGLLDGVFPAGGAPCRYGCRIDTPKVRGAWTVLAHQACAQAILELSAEDAVPLLQQYAGRYAGLDPHDGAQSWMLRGRLFQQALTEAVWAVAIGRAAWALTDRGVDVGDQVRAMLDSLAEAALAARDSLVAEGKFTSNYVAWFTAAGAACTRKPDWLEGEHGLYQHLLAATAADGWQWEASTYYHVFVLHAAVQAIDAVPGATPPDAVRNRLAAMYDVLQILRTDGGTGPPTSKALPALHDGPYTRAPYDAELATVWRSLVRSDGTRERPGAASGPVSSLPTNEPLLVKGGYAVLRGRGLTGVVDFGAHGGSHGHRDKLALYLYGGDVAWQPDPGQVPYGHAYWRGYYASTAAHPVFSVDGLEQAECAGRLVERTDRSVTVACDEAYDGVRATRRVTLTEQGLTDELTVECDRPRRITAQLRPAVELEVRPGTTRWAAGLAGRHECDVAAEFVVRPGPGPADDPQRVVRQVDWTAAGTTRATFRSSYTVEG